MKKILYFILAIITLAYVGVLCYANIATNEPTWIYYIELYGGLVIALAYAAINFFGSPLKIVLFILLVLAVVVLVLTIFIPEFFRELFGIVA
ncbi:MAG: hypothetical protein J6A28_02485 [Clostridia bacterium]|nr:hypothetical protein [Clostridia bacterium]